MMLRGDCYAIRAPRGALGHEQAGARPGVVIQADAFDFLSTVLIAPTSTRVRAASFRPVIEIDGVRTAVLVEQAHAATAHRLGERLGRLTGEELAAVDAALRDVLDLFD
jgi:mRNA interferase MazF